MQRYKGYIRYTIFLLIMVFVVILAGGVVRMTQSGMGCPDWPTCFGRWIPPLSASDLPPDYEKYLRQQDIDHHFNVYHTWIEYINRLLGTLLGGFILVHVAWSFRLFFKTRRGIFWWSFALLILVGFQGWLGKKVVDANLAVVKITAHMLVALVIAAIPVYILSRINEKRVGVPRRLRVVTLLVLILVICQVILGTGVREQIDEISRSLSYGHRERWIGMLNGYFQVHRSFSWLVAIGCCYLYISTRKIPTLRAYAGRSLALVLLAIGLGLGMNFLDVPALAQPLHLLAASLLAISLLAFRLQMRRAL